MAGHQAQKNRKRFLSPFMVLGLAFSTLVAMAPSASASSVVYDNLGETPTSTTFIMRSNSAAGMKFTVDADATVTQIRWQMGNSSYSNDIKARFYTNVAGKPATFIGQLDQSAWDSGAKIRTYTGSVDVSAGENWIIFQCASCANQDVAYTTSTTKTGAWGATYDAPVSTPTRVFQWTQGYEPYGNAGLVSTNSSFAWDVSLILEITATPSADTAAPTLSSSTPTDNATGVTLGSNLTLNFSENVSAIAGHNITLVNQDDASDNRVIAVDDAQVSVSGSQVTVNPTSDLLLGANYNVLIDAGAFEDAAGNAFAGISSGTVLNFSMTGPPTLSSSVPSDGATAVKNNANLVLNFSAAVTAVSGKSIQIVNSDTSEAVTIAADAAEVTGSGTTQITIDPVDDLDIAANYHVLMDAGAFVDGGSIGTAAITSSSVLNFATDVVPYSGLTVALDAADSASYSGSGSTWTDLSGSGNHLTLYNSPTYSSGAIKSFSFASSSFQYGDFAAQDLLNNAGYTKLVWFKPTGLTAVNNLFSSRGTSAHAFWGGGDNASCTAAGDNLAAGHNGAWLQVSSSECMDAEWQLGVVSFSNTDGWKLYRNGVLVGQDPDTAEISLANAGYYSQIARYSTSYYFDGLISQVYLYERALSSTEINGIFEATASYFDLNLDTVTFNPNGGSVDISTLRTGVDGSLTLRTPTKANANFLGWYTASTGGTKVGDAGASYTPGADATLFAQWDPSYRVTYSAGTNATGAPSNADYLGSTGALTLPTPSRADYVFDGWYTAASGGTRVGGAGASYSPSADLTLHGRWTQASLSGIAAGDLTEVNSTTIVSGVGSSNTHTIGSSSVSVNIPSNSLPAGSVVKVYSVANNARAQALLPSESDFVNSMVVSWTASDTTVPTASSPLTMVIVDASIKEGAKVYSIVGDSSTLLATATQDGTVTVSFTTDPLVTIANPAIVPPPGSSGGGGGVSPNVVETTPAPSLDAGQDPSIEAGSEYDIVLLGSGLDQITKVLIAGQSVEFEVLVGEKITISSPAQAAGSVTIELMYEGGSLTQELLVREVSSAKVNAGSFHGVVALYAKGYLDRRFSAKVGNDWVVVERLKSRYVRIIDRVGVGYNIMVRLFIDGVLVKTVPLLTKY